MAPLLSTSYQFNSAVYLTEKINLCLSGINAGWISIFDQNGYILTKLAHKQFKMVCCK